MWRKNILFVCVDDSSPRCEARCLTVVAVNCVELLGDPDEGGPAAQLLQFPRPDIGAGGPDPAQYVPYSDLHRTFVGDFHRLPLRRSGVSKKTHAEVSLDRTRTSIGRKRRLTCTQPPPLHASSWPCRSSFRRTACTSSRFSQWSLPRSPSGRRASRPASRNPLRLLKPGQK